MTTTLIPDDNEPTFESLADAMPETASGFVDGTFKASASVDDVEKDGGDSLLDDTSLLSSNDGPIGSLPSPRKQVNVSKQMKKAMKKFKSKAANVPIMWFHAQAKNNPEWELDDDEKEMLQDAIDICFEVLDIDILIEPLNITLTSIWWIVSYPLLAFLFLFLTKKSWVMESEKPNAE